MLHRLPIILKVVGLFCTATLFLLLGIIELVLVPLEYLFFGSEKTMFCWKIFGWASTELSDNMEF